MIIYLFIIMTLAVQPILAGVISQSNTSEQIILEAKKVIFQAVNTANLDLFTEAKSMIKPLVNDGRFSSLAYYYVGYIDYRMGVLTMRFDENRSEAYLDSAIEHLELALKQDEQFAEAYALLSSCYGIKISFSPIKGIYYGPKSNSLISKAKEIASENPRVALLDAIGTYNTPAIFGGGKEKGLQKMKQAAELFKRWKDDNLLQPDWGKEEVYAWIGIANAKLKNFIEARKAFERALEINPEYGWVKYNLLPKLMQKVKTIEAE